MDPFEDFEEILAGGSSAASTSKLRPRTANPRKHAKTRRSSELSFQDEEDFEQLERELLGDTNDNKGPESSAESANVNRREHLDTLSEVSEELSVDWRDEEAAANEPQTKVGSDSDSDSDSNSNSNSQSPEFREDQEYRNNHQDGEQDLRQQLENSESPLRINSVLNLVSDLSSGSSLRSSSSRGSSRCVRHNEQNTLPRAQAQTATDLPPDKKNGELKGPPVHQKQKTTTTRARKSQGGRRQLDSLAVSRIAAAPRSRAKVDATCTQGEGEEGGEGGEEEEITQDELAGEREEQAQRRAVVVSSRPAAGPDSAGPAHGAPGPLLLSKQEAPGAICIQTPGQDAAKQAQARKTGDEHQDEGDETRQAVAAPTYGSGCSLLSPPSSNPNSPQIRHSGEKGQMIESATKTTTSRHKGGQPELASESDRDHDPSWKLFRPSGERKRRRALRSPEQRRWHATWARPQGEAAPPPAPPAPPAPAEPLASDTLARGNQIMKLDEQFRVLLNSILQLERLFAQPRRQSATWLVGNVCTCSCRRCHTNQTEPRGPPEWWTPNEASCTNFNDHHERHCYCPSDKFPNRSRAATALGSEAKVEAAAHTEAREPQWPGGGCQFKAGPVQDGAHAMNCHNRPRDWRIPSSYGRCRAKGAAAADDGRRFHQYERRAPDETAKPTVPRCREDAEAHHQDQQQAGDEVDKQHEQRVRQTIGDLILRILSNELPRQSSSPAEANSTTRATTTNRQGEASSTTSRPRNEQQDETNQDEFTKLKAYYERRLAKLKAEIQLEAIEHKQDQTDRVHSQHLHDSQAAAADCLAGPGLADLPASSTTDQSVKYSSGGTDVPGRNGGLGRRQLTPAALQRVNFHARCSSLLSEIHFAASKLTRMRV